MGLYEQIKLKIKRGCYKRTVFYAYFQRYFVFNILFGVTEPFVEVSLTWSVNFSMILNVKVFILLIFILFTLKNRIKITEIKYEYRLVRVVLTKNFSFSQQFCIIVTKLF